jgi:hypothetical protein
LFPTLARIALDVLPAQASSVPCERMFSGSKQVATDRRACLGSIVFEELVIMKSAWGPDLYDMAAWNAADTTGISASTVASNSVVLFQQFVLKLHLSTAKTSNIYKNWDSDGLPIVAI